MAIASIIVYPNFYLAIHYIIDSLEMQFLYFAKKIKKKSSNFNVMLKLEIIFLYQLMNILI